MTTTLRQLLLSVAVFSSTLAQNSARNPAILYGDGGRLQTSALAREPAIDAPGFDSNYKLSLLQPVQDKNFYLLSLFQRDAAVRRLLLQNKVLRQFADDDLAALKKAASCNVATCADELFRIGSARIERVSAQLEKLANQPAFKSLVKRELRPSGVFIKYADQTDAQMLVSAWRDAANGMNRILSVYGVGKDPRYPAIDKVSFDVSSEAYRDLLRSKIREIKFVQQPLFFEPTLDFALKLLEINRRDEAGRYEPLERGENKAAVQNLKNIRWSDYPYSFILVLGSGGNDLTTRISAIGAKRTDVAAQLFFQHKAPLIIVSGGFVHPMQTPFCEAIEMKQYLMEKYEIPEADILIDPQARHTTTNFRNAARLAFRYRMPTDRTALVTSTDSHITYCANEDFRRRNLDELGYVPFEFIKQVSPTEAEFKPSIMSLFFDANDPLDP